MAPPLGVAALCLYHCSPRVAREIRGILTCRCPYLPQPYRLRSHKSAQLSFRYWWQHVARVSFVISLKRTPHGTNWRRPCASSQPMVYGSPSVCLYDCYHFVTSMSKQALSRCCAPIGMMEYWNIGKMGLKIQKYCTAEPIVGGSPSLNG